MTDRQRLEAIVDVVRSYLPPDGISREEAMSQIIEIVDPLPEQPEPWDTSDMAHRTGGLSADLGTDRGAWSDVPDATKWVDELRGDEDSEQEPVAWDGDCVLGHCGSPDGCDRFGRCRAAPPSKPWVSLTDEEIKGILDCGRGGLVDIKKAEQILKEKNT